MNYNEISPKKKLRILIAAAYSKYLLQRNNKFLAIWLWFGENIITYWLRTWTAMWIIYWFLHSHFCFEFAWCPMLIYMEWGTIPPKMQYSFSGEQFSVKSTSTQCIQLVFHDIATSTSDSPCKVPEAFTLFATQFLLFIVQLQLCSGRIVYHFVPFIPQFSPDKGRITALHPPGDGLTRLSFITDN